ncbi:hypothetical protein FHX64_002644 [Microbacter margulisiae]|uniref:Uncharacterized protein n=1 Tax=Microbacter margulisiae TaxID=1350067 RepID=A0A7W5DT53_9PORP|nr:hypothetical protein [Microbacter margulisiae]
MDYDDLDHTSLILPGRKRMNSIQAGKNMKQLYFYILTHKTLQNIRY